uniref:Uncharacterized protein n=1 Tax=Arundo donax TaxID=35708 RepID=A0A0A9DEG6_ARUDO
MFQFYLPQSVTLGLVKRKQRANIFHIRTSHMLTAKNWICCSIYFSLFLCCTYLVPVDLSTMQK